MALMFKLRANLSFWKTAGPKGVFRNGNCSAVVRLTTRGVIGGGPSVHRFHPFEVDTNVPRDVTLFRHENARFFRLLNYFAVSQLIFWSYLAYFGYTSLRSPLSKKRRPLEEPTELDAAKPEAEVSWWRTVDLGTNKFRTGFSVVCTTIGFSVFIGSLFFTRRSVRTLTLLQGGHRVRLACYSPWTYGDRIVEVPLDHLNCLQSRALQRGHLPIQVLGHRFYFLLDHEGEYTNTQLFDYTAGLRRSWAK